MLKKTYNFILDLLFPKFCVGCGKEGFWLCADCKNKIVFIQKPTCPNCNRLTAEGQFCRRCRLKSSITGVIVAAYYQEGPLKEAIHTFKYDGVFDLSHDLGQLLSAKLNLIPLRPSIYSGRSEPVERAKWNKVGVVIIPVPLHFKRRAKRGFNQAELLAKEIVKTYPHCLLLVNSLTRIRQTDKSQVELSGKARRENVQGIFSWRGQQDGLKGKTILLVDDIYTTGATLQECAEVLRCEAGAKEVWGVVLARA